MYLLFIWRGEQWFWWGEINFEGHWKGWALKIEAFLGPYMTTSKASTIWAHVYNVLRGERGVLCLRQINTCSKVPLQEILFRWRHFALPSMSLIFHVLDLYENQAFIKIFHWKKTVALISSCPFSNSLNLGKKLKSCDICKNHAPRAAEHSKKYTEFLVSKRKEKDKKALKSTFSKIRVQF